MRWEWPWLGPVFAIRWDTVGLAEDDPARGFALNETPTIRQAFQTAATQQTIATTGTYPATHPSGQYDAGWRFALSQADIPRREPRTLTISFEGTRLDLSVNRGPYRGYLWVTIDGQPANALPQDGQGRSYVVLYDPLRGSERVTLAHQLPAGPHQAVIEAEGGWGQWAVSGLQVYNETDSRSARVGLTIAGLLAVVTGLGLGWQFMRHLPTLIKQTWAWSEIFVALYAILREPGQLWLTFGLALAFYLAPGFVALLLLPFLAVTILLRPDLGLALIAFSLSFFQAPKSLPLGTFSPVELALLLTLAGFIFRGFLALGRFIFDQSSVTSYRSSVSQLKSKIQNPKSTDWAALALVFLALIATFAAQNFGVSMREWRVVVCESVLFYFLVRLGVDFGGQEQPQGRWVWRLIDAFVAGAALQALIALYLYFFTDQAITAEGVRRALGLAYGSPNNLSLFLDRAWPLLLAVAIVPGSPQLRRGLYGTGLLILSLALYLTFSKGALLVGLPVGLVAMALLYTLRGVLSVSKGERGQQWRRGLVVALAGLLLLGAALVPLSQTERFRTTFDLSAGGTGFFRLKLWEASLTMLGEHWLVGVGLDNFLYQYRTRYILPEAWQEPNLSHPHNLILDFGTRLGIGGIFILLWLQLTFWRNAWRLYQRSASPLILGLMGSMVIFLSHGLVDNSYFLVDLAFAFFLNVGIVQRLSEEGWKLTNPPSKTDS
jgi:O-antigen ligase